MIDEEARLAIERTAADRGHEVPDQAARDFRREQYGAFARRKRACVQARERAFGGLAADARRVGKIRRRAHRLVPVVALHAGGVLRDQRTGQRVARAALRADEALRRRVHRQRLPRLHARAFRVGDARARTAGVLDLDAERDRRMRVERPRVPQVEVGKFAGKALRIGEACARVFFGVFRDRARLLDRLRDRIGLQVGRARRALALAEVDRDAERAITRVLDRLDLAEAHVDAQPRIDAGADFGFRRARCATTPDDVLGEARESVELRLAVVGDGVC